jgi:hypothetical protein
MFRFLSTIFLAIFVLDLAVSAIETRRVQVMGGVVLKRKRNPVGYWLVTLLSCLVAIGGVMAVLFLAYLALTGSGPYKEHAFFSFHQVWPYAATSALFGWIAFKIVKDRRHQLKSRKLRPNCSLKRTNQSLRD